MNASWTLLSRHIVLPAVVCVVACASPTTAPPGSGFPTGNDATATDGGASDTAETKSCAGTLSKCGDLCVDTAANLAHCGQCDRVCGAGQVCDKGTCRLLPDDCALSGGCPPGFFCEPTDKKCKPGCLLPTDCPTGGTCNAATKICACNSGTHTCGQACVANTSPASCGSSCKPCPAIANAEATCDGTTCGFACKSGFELCDGKCLTKQQCLDICKPCANTPANAVATCLGTTCDFTCNPGYHRCGNTCASNTSVNSCGLSCSPCQSGPNVSEMTCDGSSCKPSKCNGGYHMCAAQCVSNYSKQHCGASCTPCPEPAKSGYAVCNGGTSCSIKCNSGTTLCGSSCTKCPSGGAITATGCSGEACVATTCKAGYLPCSGKCDTCPAAAIDTHCWSGGCQAKKCGAATTLKNGDCVGLKGQKVGKLTDWSPVGVDHLADGTAVFAFDKSYYGKSLRVVTVGTDGKLGKESAVGNKDARGLAFAIDSKDVQHIVWVTSPFNGANVLYHASRNGLDKFTKTVVPLQSTNLWRTGLAITASDDLRLLVTDGSKKKLLHFERNGGKWSAPTALPIFSGRDFAIAVDAAGKSHVVASDNTVLRYASGSGSTHTVGDKIQAGWTKQPSLAVDTKSVRHVAWTSKTGAWYVKSMGAKWSTPVQLAKSAYDDPTALAVDAKGVPHVAFAGCHGNICGARFGTPTGGKWHFQALKASGNLRYFAAAIHPKVGPALVVGSQSDGVYGFTGSP